MDVWETSGGLELGIKTIFYNGANKNMSRVLSVGVLRRGLQALGLNPTIQEAKAIMKKHDIEGRKIAFEQFERILAEKAGFDLVESFRVFDKDSSGTLKKDELAQYLSGMAERLSEAELDELFNALDINKDGKLSLIETSKLLAN